MVDDARHPHIYIHIRARRVDKELRYNNNMNNTIRPLSNGDFEVLKDKPSTAKKVVKDAPSTEILESGKPALGKDDKAAKKSFEDKQFASDALIM